MTVRDEYGGLPLSVFECVALMRQAIDGLPLTCPTCGDEGFYGLPINQPSTHYVCTYRRHFYRVDDDIKKRAWAFVDADFPVNDEASSPIEDAALPALQFHSPVDDENNDIYKPVSISCSICHREWIKLLRSRDWWDMLESHDVDIQAMVSHVQSHLS